MDPKLIALHKHWLAADAVKQVALIKIGPEDDQSELLQFAYMHSAFSRLSVMYGLLYVVIEGYRELKLEDAAVDELLSNEEFVDSLRLFRNSVFHYQKHPTPEKALKFLTAENSENWIRALHSAFNSFFCKTLPIRETLEQLKREVESA